MSDSNKAVFLSYASQDAEAARCICEALRQAGIEVWFDQSELRGGDAWDQKIRQQIRECALFMPVISQHTQQRLEGYFRREWRLGAERMIDMDDDLAFLLPVIVDGTSDSGLHVPERFRERQWTRLPGGATPAAFCERVKKLLGCEAVAASLAPPGSCNAGQSIAPRSAGREPRATRRTWLVASSAGLVAVLGLIVWRPWHRAEQVAPPAANAPEIPIVATPTAPVSEAGRLVERARAITQSVNLTRAQLEAAAELCDRALALDSTDAAVWIAAARTDLLLIYPHGYDRSDERRKRAQTRAARAVSLAPDSLEAQVVQAAVLAHAVGTPALLAEAEKTFRALIASHPDDRELVVRLAEVLRDQRRFAEAAALFEKIGEREVAAWNLYLGGDARGALAAVERSLREKRSVEALQLKAIVQSGVLEDPEAAQATLDQIRPSELLAELPAAVALQVALFRRDPERILQIAQGLPHDFLDSAVFRGPRQYFTGQAQELSGHSGAAENEWRAGLAVAEERLKSAPDDRELVLVAAWFQAALGERRKADRLLARAQALAGLERELIDERNVKVFLRLGRNDAVVAWLTAALKAKAPLWEAVHAEARFAPAYDRLRAGKRIDKLLRETLPNGAKPFDATPANPNSADDRR